MSIRNLIPLTFGVLCGVFLYTQGVPLVQEFLYPDKPLCIVEDLENPGGWVKIYEDSLQPCDPEGCYERLYPTNDLEQFMLDMVIDIRCNGAPIEKYFEDSPNPPDADIEDFNSGHWRQEAHQ